LAQGQRTRLALAVSLAANPAMLVVDDPTAGLTAAETPAVLTVLDRVRAELGITVLITTADSDVARRACDSLSLLRDGTVVESGPVLGCSMTPGVGPPSCCSRRSKPTTLRKSVTSGQWTWYSLVSRPLVRCCPR